MTVMFGSKNLSVVLMSLVLAFVSLCSWGAPPALDANEMRDIMDIAKRIHRLQPNLDEGKYLEYATGIYRASIRYDIEADILLAITKQETSFREDLPEGAAGELGICQIRKMWVSQPDFQKEFPKAKKKDLLRPAKSFMFAAWILRDLKNKSSHSTIPYWSFYNAKKFEPRLRYYTAVSRHLAELNQYDSGVEVQQIKYSPGPSAKNEKKYESAWSPEPIRFVAASQTWSPEPIRISGKSSRNSRKPAAEQSSWISSALKKLQEKNKKTKIQGLSDGAILQAATELSSVTNLIKD